MANLAKLSNVDIAKLNHLSEKGFDPRVHNADFYLQVAVEADDIKNQIGPFDPAFTHYAERARIAMDAALIAEKLRG